MNRRHLLATALAVPAVAARLNAAAAPAASAAANKLRPYRIGVSTYSFWHFDEKTARWRDMERCLEAATEMGFDGVELLQVQMSDTTPAGLNKIKRRAFTLGMPLMGFS